MTFKLLDIVIHMTTSSFIVKTKHLLQIIGEEFSFNNVMKKLEPKYQKQSWFKSGTQNLAQTR